MINNWRYDNNKKIYEQRKKWNHCKINPKFKCRSGGEPDTAPPS